MGIDVAIVMGSASDWEVMSNAQKMLNEFGVKAESRVLSAHRTPKELEAFIKECEEQNVKVFIAGAGMSAALPGVVAALTTTPVIGVPLNASSLDGMDALMSIVQMPPGIPVGTVSIGKPGAINAALYAIAMMAVNDPQLSEKLKDYRKEQAEKVLSAELS
jgi:5-(carboxyamino)imidazole ribonucleotide mutase